MSNCESWFSSKLSYLFCMRNNSRRKSDLVRKETNISNNRVVLVGAERVGKSSLISRLVYNEFSHQYKPNLQLEQINYQKMNLLDTIGHEPYQPLRDSYIRWAHGYILVYDVHNRSSFHALNSIYQQIILLNRTKGQTRIPMILVANKCDINDRMFRTISTALGIEMARYWNCEYMETSAKDGYGVECCFRLMIQLLKDIVQIKIHLEIPKYEEKIEKAVEDVVKSLVLQIESNESNELELILDDHDQKLENEMLIEQENIIEESIESIIENLITTIEHKFESY